MELSDLTSDTDLETQQILLAASQHDTSQLRILLRTGSASVQDPETGYTPLHSAIAACKPSLSPEQDSGKVNGHELNGLADGTSLDERQGTEDDEIRNAAKTMKLLLENGAIWNDVDKNNETPGCLALRLGFEELYTIMVDAGVRAEILLNRLEEYEALADGSDEDEEAAVDSKKEEAGSENGSPSKSNVQAQDVASELKVNTEPNSEDYLRSNLQIQNDSILDESRNGVMMAWESGIMKHTADLLVPKAGLRVLNIGHGMGIIDSILQAKSPMAHHIIEAHPDILAHMRRDGWYEKANVTIHEGRWQDAVPKIIDQSLLFDAIYFDTFAEDYKALRDFFSDQLIGLLEDSGKWSFFNGLGADRQICYDVYAKVVEMDLFEAGFDTEWKTVPVPDLGEATWRDVKRRYWMLNSYRLPICSFTG
ncbi:protein arginine N-methyltransferase 2 [Physcia stellaris]|nr:protein arginine N-methyltransferase 2 [Physcia stellaris]